MFERTIVNKNPLEPYPLEIQHGPQASDKCSIQSVLLHFMCPGVGGEVSLHRHSGDDASEEEGDLHPRQIETSSAGDD